MLLIKPFYHDGFTNINLKLKKNNIFTNTVKVRSKDINKINKKKIFTKN